MINVHIKTYGCSFNQADSERMAGLLSYAGYNLVDAAEQSDVVTINSCTVKNMAESKVFQDIRKFDDKKIIVAGCVPQAEQSYADTRLKEYSLVGTYQLHQIAHAVEETVQGNRVVFLEKEKNQRILLPKIRRNSIVEIVPINEGCLGNCSFCKTKQARGNLFSYEQRAIVQQVRRAVDEGCKEIWLTSQDTAVYGYDLKTNLPQLLHELLEIPGDFFIRLGMGNPDFFQKHAQELIEIFKHPKMFKFLHIPIQTGNDAVLRDMLRGYTVAEFKAIVEAFRREIPEMTISTDIICGFPTETQEQFADTLKLVEDIHFDVINISRFWQRPGTKAAALKQLPSKVGKERAAQLKTVHEQTAYERNQRWIGWKGTIVIDEQDKYGSFVGRNYCYRPVLVKGSFKLGEIVSVMITEVTKRNLRGKVISPRHH